jgi:Spy/CpxP family protein refolding chaperone
MVSNKKTGEATLLVVVVFLLGVLLGGLATHIWGGHIWAARAPLSHRDQVISDLTRELDLTPQQKQQVTAVIDKKMADIHDLYAPLEPQREQIREKGRDQIRAVLTPEQNAKFDAFLKKLDDQRPPSTQDVPK